MQTIAVYHYTNSPLDQAVQHRGDAALRLALLYMHQKKFIDTQCIGLDSLFIICLLVSEDWASACGASTTWSGSAL